MPCRFSVSSGFSTIDSDWWDPEPAQAVAYLTRLFEEPEPPLYWFTDAQIAQGLTYLVSTSATGDKCWLYAPEVPIAERIRCVDAVAPLFAKLFLPRCTPHLSHLSEPVTGPVEYRVLHVVGRISMHRAAGRPALSHAAPARPASDGAHPDPGIDRLPGKRIARARPLAASLSRRGDRDHRPFSEKRRRPRRKACRLREIGPLRLRALITPGRAGTEKSRNGVVGKALHPEGGI